MPDSELGGIDSKYRLHTMYTSQTVGLLRPAEKRCDCIDSNATVSFSKESVRSLVDAAAVDIDMPLCSTVFD